MTEEDIEFGDIDEDDGHQSIEDWEDFDRLLAERGMSEDERREYWRALDPDTPVLDWHASLVADGMDPEEAQALIRAIGASNG